MPTSFAAGTKVESISSNIDDKTLHELYLWPFADAVRAGTGSIMCSYNRANNSHGCQNSKLLNGLLKTELGFQGFGKHLPAASDVHLTVLVLSDWTATHSGVGSALAGLDMEMPSGTFFGPLLVEAVTNGSVPESRLDDMATRVIAAWYQMGQDQNFTAHGAGVPVDVTIPHTIINAKDPASKSTLLQGAVEGHVLVKNVGNALPLNKPQLLSIFGYDAQSPQKMDPQGAALEAGLGVGEQFAWIFGLEAVNLSDIYAAYAGALLNNANPPSPQTQIASGGSLIL